MLPVGGTVVAFCRRMLALGTWNLQMSWCKYPGVPWGQPPGMAADKCIISAGRGKELQVFETESSLFHRFTGSWRGLG